MKDLFSIPSLSFNEEVMFMETNPKYQEVLKLDKLMASAEIPHKTSELLDGWKVAYTPEGENRECVSDAVEHLASIGHTKDALEIMGFSFSSGKIENDFVYGNLSAIEVFWFWSHDYKRRYPAHYHVGAYMKTWKELAARTFCANTAEKHKIMKHWYGHVRAGNIYKENFNVYSGLNLIELSVLATMFDDIDFIRALTGYQTRAHFISYILDELIQIAISQKNYDIQMMLTNYKYQHELFRENKFEL